MAEEFSAVTCCGTYASVLVKIYKEIEIKDMSQFDQQSGFVAGTLVHTENGLVHIEHLKGTRRIHEHFLSFTNTQNNV